mmetsp:Transcript_25176/g.37292  ORF Transcript_25176/g.37292 Transcript_25176/m.37292 type:complete len:81 (-) Transcript_25176:23-265(-)
MILEGPVWHLLFLLFWSGCSRDEWNVSAHLLSVLLEEPDGAGVRKIAVRKEVKYLLSKVFLKHYCVTFAFISSYNTTMHQ